MKLIFRGNTFSNIFDKPSFLIGFALFSYFILISIFNYTVTPVDSLYLRGYLPWADNSPSIAKSYDWALTSHRGGEAMYETPYHIIDYLKQLDTGGNTDFSYHTNLGYPLKVGFAWSHGIAFPVARILKIFYPGEYEKIAYLTANLVAGFWVLFFAIILGSISKLILKNGHHHWLLSIIANPVIFLDTEEGWILAVGGLLVLLWGVLLVNNNGKKLTLFSSFVFILSSYFIYGSGIYQFFIYLPLCYLLFAFYLKNEFGWKILLGIGFLLAIGAFLNLHNLLKIVETIELSAKSHLFYETPSIRLRGYAPIPIQPFLGLPTLYFIKNRFLHILVPETFYFGFPIVALAFIAGKDVIKKSLKIPIIIIIMYWAGIIHYPLTFFAGVIRTETSIRIWLILYLIFCLLATYVINNKTTLLKYKKIIQKLNIIFFLITILQFTTIYLHLNKIWLSGIVQIFSFATFYIALHKFKTSNHFMILALLLIPLSHSFFGNSNQHLIPQKIQLGLWSKKPEIDKTISDEMVGALVSTPNQKVTFHPNFWYSASSKIRSVHAYRNPFGRYYHRLFLYALEKSENLRSNWQTPFIINNGKLREEAQRFFNITGVNLVAIRSNSKIKGDWKPFKKLGTIDLYTRDLPFSPVRGVCNTLIEKNEKKSVRILLEDSSFNIENQVLIHNEVPTEKCIKKVIINVGKLKNNGQKFDIETKSSIFITTNIAYYPDLEISSVKKVPVNLIRCNLAFTCFHVTAAFKGSISLIYNSTFAKSLNRKWNSLLR